MQTETDVNGNYEIQNVPVGTYNVTASKPGYLPKTVEDVQILEDQTTTVNFVLDEEEVRIKIQTKPIRGSRLDITHRLSRGMVGCWRFNEGTGGKVFDLSGNGNHGDFGAGSAAPTWVAGRSGLALDFDGIDDHVSPNKNFDISTTENYSMYAWVKTTSTTIGAIIERGVINTGNLFYGTGLYFDISVNYAGADNKVWFMRNIGANGANEPIDAVSTSNANDGNWHFIVGVFDGTNDLLYFDGVLEATTAKGNDLVYHATYDASTIGALDYKAGIAHHFASAIDGAGIYNRALSAVEIAWLYREPYAIDEK